MSLEGASPLEPLSDPISKRPLGGRSRSELMISTDVSSRDDSTPPELPPKPTPRPSPPLSLTLSDPLSLPSPPPPPLSTLCSPSSLDRRRMTFPPKQSVSRGMPWNDVAPPLVPLCRSAGGSPSFAARCCRQSCRCWGRRPGSAAAGAGAAVTVFLITRHAQVLCRWRRRQRAVLASRRQRWTTSTRRTRACPSHHQSPACWHRRWRSRASAAASGDARNSSAGGVGLLEDDVDAGIGRRSATGGAEVDAGSTRNGSRFRCHHRCRYGAATMKPKGVCARWVGLRPRRHHASDGGAGGGHSRDADLWWRGRG